MDLTSPSVVLEIIKKFDLRLTKAYGQNFLVDKNILNKIIQAADLKKDDVVLEIGPGIGTLSHAIAEKIKKLYLVEIDKKLIGILKQTLEEHSNIEIIQADALRFDFSKLKPKPNKLVSNLPYNVASPLLIKVLTEMPSLAQLTVMIQKEMAQRLMANPKTKEYSGLSLKIRFLCETEKLFDVSKNVFLPKPKINSTVITLNKKPPLKVDQILLFSLLEKAFLHRRKSLRNSLLNWGKFNEAEIDDALKQSRVKKNQRAEELTLEQFTKIANYLKNGS